MDKAATWDVCLPHGHSFVSQPLHLGSISLLVGGAVGGGSGAWAPHVHTGDLGETPGSWLWSEAGVWGVNQQLEDSLSVSLSPAPSVTLTFKMSHFFKHKKIR